MTISFKNSTRHVTQFIVCGLVLFSLLFTSVVNASADTSPTCKDMDSSVDGMMMHESMNEDAECCQLGLMPDCCETCHVSVYYFSNSLEFFIDKPESVTVVRLVQQHSSINPPPLLRPPVIS